MSFFNIVATTTENTVVASYEPVKNRSDSYQSESALEREFISLLTQQGYEYLQIHQEARRKQYEYYRDKLLSFSKNIDRGAILWQMVKSVRKLI